MTGQDRIFNPAKAEVKSRETVDASGSRLAAPQMILHGWAIYPHGANLDNRRRLPVVGFEMTKPGTALSL